LYEKPKIGENPFKPMEHSRPDRVSDGVKEVMLTVAKCYERREYDYIWYKSVVKTVSMHRLTLDKYLKEAVAQGLLSWRTDDTLTITNNGIKYLETHNIIEA